MSRVTRRSLLAALAVAASGCIGGDDASDDTDASEGSLSISSLAFDDGGEIPAEYTCDGADSSPPLRIEGVPDEAESLALVVDDPDAPDGAYVHWLLWNLPADTRQIPQSVPHGPAVEELGGAEQATNDSGEVGYSGPCPPEGDGPHSYRFSLYAVEGELDVDAGSESGQVLGAIEDAAVAEAALTGLYGR